MLKVLRYMALAAAAVSMPSASFGQALPPGTATRPVQLTKMVAKLNRGEKVGHYSVGVVCWLGEDISWKSGGKTPLDTDEFDEVFRDELQKLGYKVAGDPANLFSEADDNSAEYLIGGTIDHLNVNLCYPMAGFGNFDKSKGSASVNVKWQIYSRLERKVVSTLSTSGSFSEKKSATGGAYVILMNAFADAVQKLAAFPEFKSVFVGEPTDLSVATGVKPGLSPITISVGANSPANFDEAIGSTMLIFSGDGHGSGFLVSSDGHLLTNQHVVGAAKFVKVRWSDGIETLGEVIRTDAGRDVALIKTDARGRLPLKIRESSVSPGEDVYAIGAPIDRKLQGSLTKGVVSASRVVNGFSYIQSDVSVNPGNSGGPLLDEQRNVVGLTVAGLAKAGVPVGINLFIPIGDAKAFLGLTSISPSPSLAGRQ